LNEFLGTRLTLCFNIISDHFSLLVEFSMNIPNLTMSAASQQQQLMQGSGAPNHMLSLGGTGYNQGFNRLNRQPSIGSNRLAGGGGGHSQQQQQQQHNNYGQQQQSMMLGGLPPMSSAPSSGGSSPSLTNGHPSSYSMMSFLHQNGGSSNGGGGHSNNMMHSNMSR
jgi:hypothetical protein